MWNWKSKRLGIVLLFVAAVGAFVCYGAYRRWQQAGITAVTRGEAAARRLGCFACHGPGGTRGIRNPGSDAENVPSWDGGTVMMYVEKEEEIREWILDGKPKRLKENPAPKALIAMPAFRGKISSRELEDLVSYFKAVAWYGAPEDPVAREGRKVAQKWGCFGCHGPEGRASLPNPGSLKGTIPAWDGPDFSEVVKDDNELKEWILEGSIGRFRRNPAAKIFLERQKIKMPGYREYLSEEELKQLMAYIRWLRKGL